MKSQLLSGAGKRVLSSVFVCSLWVCAAPTDARAQAKFGDTTCYIQSVNNGKMVAWQIKGTSSVTGLNPQNASVTVTFTFSKMPKGGTKFTTIPPTVQQTTNGNKGNASFDTGWQSLGDPPQSGDQYKVIVSGYYIDGTGKQVTIEPVGSPPITPVP